MAQIKNSFLKKNIMGGEDQNTRKKYQTNPMK
jgi:hypothetical protein